MEESNPFWALSRPPSAASALSSVSTSASEALTRLGSSESPFVLSSASASASSSPGSGASFRRFERKRHHFQHTITADVIPQKFAQWGEEFPWIHSMIEKGMYLRCNVTKTFHPAKFYVQLLETYPETDEFDTKLQNWINRDFMRNNELKPKYVPKVACIQPGLYILCKHDYSWHRARVLSLVIHNKLKVDLIDIGLEISVGIQDVAYILRDMMTALKPQAIQCRLRFGEPFNSYLASAKMFHKEAWSTAAKTDLQAILFENQLGITFHKYSTHQKWNAVTSGIWTVSVNCLIPGEFDLLKITPNEEDKEKDTTDSDSAKKTAEAQPQPVVADDGRYFPDGSLAEQVLIYDISTMLTEYILPPQMPMHPVSDVCFIEQRTQNTQPSNDS